MDRNLLLYLPFNWWFVIYHSYMIDVFIGSVRGVVVSVLHRYTPRLEIEKKIQKQTVILLRNGIRNQRVVSLQYNTLYFAIGTGLDCTSHIL